MQGARQIEAIQPPLSGRPGLLHSYPPASGILSRAFAGPARAVTRAVHGARPSGQPRGSPRVPDTRRQGIG
jgi:hypothetical protein